MTLPEDYFDALYAGSPDPWGFEDRWYERRKRDLTLAALPDARYGSAFEPGCSMGLLTAALADRCDAVLSSDVSAAALAQAAVRLSGRSHVRLEHQAVPAWWPTGGFDLVLLSELLYYLGDDDVRLAADLAVRAVRPGGTLLSVHWRHPVADYPQTGDAVQAMVAAAARGQLVPTVEHVEQDLHLTVHVRPHDREDPTRVSVAARTGLC